MWLDVHAFSANLWWVWSLSIYVSICIWWNFSFVHKVYDACLVVDHYCLLAHCIVLCLGWPWATTLFNIMYWALGLTKRIINELFVIGASFAFTFWEAHQGVCNQRLDVLLGSDCWWEFGVVQGMDWWLAEHLHFGGVYQLWPSLCFSTDTRLCISLRCLHYFRHWGKSIDRWIISKSEI